MVMKPKLIPQIQCKKVKLQINCVLKDTFSYSFLAPQAQTGDMSAIKSMFLEMKDNIESNKEVKTCNLF